MFKSKEKKFWSWFLKNKSKLEDFIKSDQKDYAIYNELTKKVKAYDLLLNIELTGDEEGFYNLIITPDGIKAGMKPSDTLFGSAPYIEGWKLFKYRQPKDDFSIIIREIDLNIESIKILKNLDLEANQFDIGVCIKNYTKENSDFGLAGFLMLDHILGEFNVLTRIRAVEFYDWDFIKPEYEVVSLLEFRKEIEEKLY